MLLFVLFFCVLLHPFVLPSVPLHKTLIFSYMDNYLHWISLCGALLLSSWMIWYAVMSCLSVFGVCYTRMVRELESHPQPEKDEEKKNFLIHFTITSYKHLFLSLEVLEWVMEVNSAVTGRPPPPPEKWQKHHSITAAAPSPRDLQQGHGGPTFITFARVSFSSAFI